MSDIDDNMLDDYETDPVAPDPVSPAAGAASAANRPFYIALGVIGGAFLLAIIAMAVYAAVVLPQRSAAREQAAALVNAQNTATSQAATQVEAAMQFAPTDTATPVPPTETPAPSATAVIAYTATPIPTDTPASIIGADMLARTATVSALLTEAAGGVLAAGAAVTPTALPKTGFAEDAGVPSLFGAAVLLMAVIFLVRRLRLVNNG